MSVDALVPKLRAMAVFPEFTEAELRALVGAMHLQKVPAGQVVFRRGSPGTACYLLLDGSVRVWIDTPGGETELAVLGQGALFGQLALLDGSPRSAHCTALKNALLLRLDRDDFEQVFRGGSAFAYKFIDVLTRILVLQLRIANQKLTQSDLERASITPDEVEALLRAVGKSTMSCDLDSLDPDDLEVVVPDGLKYRQTKR
jgi:CRP/FNR family cyclic AMP-dependent transcriptional regulator